MEGSPIMSTDDACVSSREACVTCRLTYTVSLKRANANLPIWKIEYFTMKFLCFSLGFPVSLSVNLILCCQQ